MTEDELFSKTIAALIFDGTLPFAPDPLRVVWDAARSAPSTAPVPVAPPLHKHIRLALDPEGYIGRDYSKRDIALFNVAEHGHCFSATTWAGVQQALKDGYCVSYIGSTCVFRMLISPATLEDAMYWCGSVDYNENARMQGCSYWHEVEDMGVVNSALAAIWFVIR